MEINFQTLSAFDGKRMLIDHGKPVNGWSIPSNPVSMEDIERLYAEYKYSVPNGIKYKRPYFKALPANQIPTEKLIHGANRQKAKDDLELTFLYGIINKTLVYPDYSKWFWQSQNDKDLVILRSWFPAEREETDE